MPLSQKELLYNLLSDQRPHRTDQIQRVVYGRNHLGLARVGARIYDIKQEYDVTITGWHDEKKPSLYWYQMTINPTKLVFKTKSHEDKNSSSRLGVQYLHSDSRQAVRAMSLAC